MAEVSQQKIQTEQSSDDILVDKGNQLHLIVLSIVAIFAILYGLLNVIKGDYLQAKINLLLFPHTIIAYLIYKKGYPAISKSINLFVVTANISVLQFVIGLEK